MFRDVGEMLRPLTIFESTYMAAMLPKALIFIWSWIGISVVFGASTRSSLRHLDR